MGQRSKTLSDAFAASNLLMLAVCSLGSGQLIGVLTTPPSSRLFAPLLLLFFVGILSALRSADRPALGVRLLALGVFGGVGVVQGLSFRCADDLSELQSAERPASRLVIYSGRIETVERVRPLEKMLRVRVDHGVGELVALLRVPDLPWQRDVQPGDHFPWQLSRPFRVKNLCHRPPPLLSYESYLLRRGVHAQGRVLQPMETEKLMASEAGEQKRSPKSFTEQLIMQGEGSDSLAVLLSVLLGRRDRLGEHLNMLFRETGLSHFLVISGFHISVVFAAARGGARRVLLRPTILRRISGEPLCSLCGLIAAALYTAVSGCELSSVRALTALGLGVLATMLCRRVSPLHAVLFSLLAVTVLWPLSFLEAGCQLTFFAIGGLLTSSRLVSEPMRLSSLSGEPSYIMRLLQRVGRGASASFFAWLFTLPVTLFWFRAVAPLAVFYNVLFVPLFSLIFVFLGLPVLLLGPGHPVAAGILWVGDQSLELLWAFHLATRESALGPLTLTRTPALTSAGASLLIAGMLSCRLWRRPSGEKSVAVQRHPP